jgi:hypothetical protein
MMFLLTLIAHPSLDPWQIVFKGNHRVSSLETQEAFRNNVCDHAKDARQARAM